MHWDQPSERQVFGPYILLKAEENIRMVRENLKAAQYRQQSYAGTRRSRDGSGSGEVRVSHLLARQHIRASSVYPCPRELAGKIFDPCPYPQDIRGYRATRYPPENTIEYVVMFILTRTQQLDRQNNDKEHSSNFKVHKHDRSSTNISLKHKSTNMIDWVVACGPVAWGYFDGLVN